MGSKSCYPVKILTKQLNNRNLSTQCQINPWFLTKPGLSKIVKIIEQMNLDRNNF